jgi:hypothetical protein
MIVHNLYSSMFSSDDWRAPNGDILPAPANEAERLFSTAYSFCIENWCVQDAAESLFKYRTSESFSEINKCGVPFSSQVEDAVLDLVENPALNQELSDACGSSLICLVDGVCGSITDAVEVLSNELAIAETQVQMTASIFSTEQVEIENVEDVPDDDTVTTTAATTPTTPEIIDIFWYPAWGKGSTESKCYNDGEAAQHMKTSGEAFFVLPWCFC